MSQAISERDKEISFVDKEAANLQFGPCELRNGVNALFVKSKCEQDHNTMLF